nr:carbamoylphosphate synthase large subunit [Propionibacterium sp.]
MTNFVYLSPAFPAIGVNFCEHLARAGVRVLGVGDTPYHELSERLRGALTEYYRVDSLADYDQAFRAVAYLSYRHGKVDWLESNNEHWLELDARLRTDFHITTGHGVELSEAIKSKAHMKPVYAFAGIPTARQTRVTDAAALLAFAADVGYPLIAKPEYGVGANDTARLASDDDVRAFCDRPRGVPYVAEEFVTGELFSYDAVVDAHGHPVFEAATRFPPSILDIVVDRLDLAYRVEAQLPPGLADAGRRTVAAFGVRNRFVHLEFFRLTAARPGLGGVGDWVGLEVNMRPAGGDTVDLFNYARDADVYQVYTDLVTGIDTGAAARAAADPQYGVYAARRDWCSYAVPRADLLAKYAGELRQVRRNPPLFSPQMGDEYFVIRTPDAARADAFVRDVTTRA